MATTTGQAYRSMNQRRAIEAALTNEQLTRERVDRLERQARDLHQRVKVEEQVLARGLRGRLRWLLTGK